MISNSEMDLIHAHRRQKTRPRTKDALRARRAGLRVDRTWRRAFLSVVLSASASLSVDIGLSEDRQSLLQATVNLPGPTQSAKPAATYLHLRSAICYRIAMSPHVGPGQLDRDIQAAQRRVWEASDPRPFWSSWAGFT